MDAQLEVPSSGYVRPGFTHLPAEGSEVEDGTELDTETLAVKNYPVAIKQKAYELFLLSSKDLTEIAMELAVPRPVIASWSHKGGWVARRQQIEREVMASTEGRFADYLRDVKLPELRAQLDASRDLQGLVQQEIKRLHEEAKRSPDKAIDTPALRRLAETLAHAANLSCRALGVVEQATGRGSETEEGRGNKKDAKVPLVMVNVVPALPAGAVVR